VLSSIQDVDIDFRVRHEQEGGREQSCQYLVTMIVVADPLSLYSFPPLLPASLA
jgi:hypothetical protein